MKTHKHALLFALLGIMLFATCSMDSDGAATGGFSAADAIIDVASIGDPITESELIGTWTCNYMFEGIDNTHTLKFGSGGNVAYFYENDYGSGNKIEGSYTYTISGSTVTIYNENGEEYMQLVNLSGQLVYVEGIFTAAGSPALGNAITASSLAGTTWTASVTDDYMGDFTVTLKFQSGGTFAYSAVYSMGDSSSFSGTYTVSDSTVTLSLENNGGEMRLIYYSGHLIYTGDMIFTKGS